MGSTLDFIVIGSQPGFSGGEVFSGGLDAWVSGLADRSTVDEQAGVVAPECMQGWHETTTATIAARIGEAFPAVRLVARLCDPVARAYAQYEMAVSAGLEQRSFEEAVTELLQPDSLLQGRFLPAATNTYVVQGEYGRILSEYLRHFSLEALDVALTDDDPRDQAFESEPVLDALRRHFAADAAVLRQLTGIEPPWASEDGASRSSTVVYTAISGGYDELLEPKVVSPDCDYVCFTDNPYLRSDAWEVRPLELTATDPVRRARRAKLLAHRYLGEYARSVWVDANLELRGDPVAFADEHLARAPFVAYVHPEARACSYDEAEVCIRLEKDDPDVIRTQMARQRDAGFPEGFGVPSTMVLARDHADPRAHALMETWWEELKRGSRRDQLALPFAAWQTGERWAEVSGDSRDNDLVLWRKHWARQRSERIRLRIDRADVVVLTYPKAGRTWVRYFLARYFAAANGQPLTLDLRQGDPAVEFSHDYFEVFQNAPGRPHLLNEDLLRARRIVVIARDPRDTLVSFRYRKRYREARAALESLDVFADSPVYGIERQAEFVNLLIDLHDSHPGDKLLVTYEDLNADPVNGLRRVLEFVLGDRPIREPAFQEALAAAGFEEMQTWERTLSTDAAESEFAQRRGPQRDDPDPRAMKVRRGVVGGFADEMSPELLRRVGQAPHTKHLIERLERIRQEAERV
jgi:hypothetical protein